MAAASAREKPDWVRPQAHAGGGADDQEDRAGQAGGLNQPSEQPPVNKAAIETPVTEPIVISTRPGGKVSVWAPL
jgi:hypothetical protein